MQPTTTSNQLFFHEQTDTFNLTVLLHNQKLTISLKDFTDWVVYQKQYTEENIGKQINRKLDLIDVYQAFSLTKLLLDDAQQKQTHNADFKKYKYGDIIYKDGACCYQIIKGGKITVYKNVIEKITKKQQIYESILKLPKARNMNQIQIFTEKSVIEKKQLLKKLKDLQQENLKLKERLGAKQDIQQITCKKQEVQSEINNFIVEGLKVQYLGINTWAHYIFNCPILHGHQIKFTIKINKTKQRHIMIGVVDQTKQKEYKSFCDSGDSMCYHGYNGYKYPEKIKQGNGFKQGDIVEVYVERISTFVKYHINGVLKAQHKNPILGEKQRVFMPFVQMHCFKDTVQWLQE